MFIRIRTCQSFHPHLNRTIAIAVVWLFFLSHSAYPQTRPDAPSGSAAAGCVIGACFIETSVVMDGLLSEPAWDLVEPARGFVQREPREGEPATEETEVRVLYDELNLYIGVSCFDREPGRIIHTELQFDGNLVNDDNFTIVLDTFADFRSGFLFCINPNGARRDGRLGSSLGGLRVNYDWNGVWDTAAHIHDDGWSAEIVIPLSTLRFPTVEQQTWGINFRRVIARKNEEVLWSAWRRDDGIMQLSRAGRLTNLENLNRGKILEVKPFLLGGVEDRTGESNEEFKYGVDVKYPLTSDLTLDLTTFTDFAQIEADRTQINLTRFNIRYPEKRDFFLEGEDIFKFGGSAHTIPFYSRRLGLTPDREAIPILLGAKVTGKTGRYSIGLLNIQTDDKKDIPLTNYSVVRVRRDIGEQSTIGMIATNIHDENGHWDRALGFDLAYRTNQFLNNKNFAILGDFSNNFQEDMNKGTYNGLIQFVYPNDLLYVMVYYKQTGEHYAPEMGFVEMAGIKKPVISVQYRPRPDIPFVRQLTFRPLYSTSYYDLNNNLLSRLNTFSPFGLTTNTEDSFVISMEQHYEYLNDDFRLFKDVMIPADIYEWWERTARFATNRNRPLSININFSSGDFYSGTKTTTDSQIVMKFSEFLSIESGAIYNKLALGSESFSTQEYSMRINTNVSPRLGIRTFVQYNNDDELVNLNFRVHCIPQIGSDIFFVYNHIWNRGQDYVTTLDATLAKIAWRFEL